MPGTWFPLKYWFDEMNNKGIKKRKGEGKERADKLGSHSGLRTRAAAALLPAGVKSCCKSKEPHTGLCWWTPIASGISNLPSKMISIKSVPSNSRKQSLDRYISANTTGIILWSSYQSSGEERLSVLKCLHVQC